MIFVTGGTGLLGAHILVELSRKGEAIRALKRSSSDTALVHSIFEHYFGKEAEEKFNKIQWVDGDITDIVSLEEAAEGCNVYYHSAAIVSFEKKDFKEMMKVNKGGTANVVNLAVDKNIDHLVYVSSVAALGRDGRNDVYTENNKWKTTPENSGYAVSKNSAEMEVWRGVEEGIPAVIVNPTIILGPGNWNESSVTFFKTMSQGMSWYPPGKNGFVDARDVAKAATQLSEKRMFNERYITVGENASFKTLFTKIAESFGKKGPHKKVKKWMLALAWRIDGFLSFFGKERKVTKENSRSAMSTSIYANEKIKHAIGFEFHSLDETIENASSFFKKHHQLN
ncbi:MAG: NAD-dependent epimerase/dehydratase family protein [Crocinitomicaceae bacterium]|nr:NAD-dependent epimerase/dehydratase family protein [Crocinitomicaceae bacterium]